MFPASAGMIPRYTSHGRAKYRVPRIRGDDPIILLKDISNRWCSPHPRG